MKVVCPKCDAEVQTDEPFANCNFCGAQFAVGEAKTTADAHPPADPLIGSVIGGCKITERIGAGGMGVVYKAEQVSLGRIVAVKLLPEPLRQDPQIRDRFQREISILAKLNHPNIVGILDGGVAEHGAYFVMEYVDGVPLRKIMAAEGGLSAVESLKIIPQICEALEYAHGIGIIHRDIKPENILIDLKGRVRLLDFGLSRIAKQDDPGLLTRATQVLGTFEYMAPEQREASRNVDHRADLYSLGVVIYEMLTGELPIGRFDPPSHKNIQVDVRLDEIVLRVLDKSPDRRYQHASELKTEVERVSSSPPVVVPPPARGDAGRAAANPARENPPSVKIQKPGSRPAQELYPPAPQNPPAGSPSSGGGDHATLPQAATALASAAGARVAAAANVFFPVPPAASAGGGFGDANAAANSPLARLSNLRNPEIFVVLALVILSAITQGIWVGGAVLASVLYYASRVIPAPSPRKILLTFWIGLGLIALQSIAEDPNDRTGPFQFTVWFPFLWLRPWTLASLFILILTKLAQSAQADFKNPRRLVIWILLVLVALGGVTIGNWLTALALGAAVIYAGPRLQDSLFPPRTGAAEFAGAAVVDPAGAVPQAPKTYALANWAAVFTILGAFFFMIVIASFAIRF